MKVFFSHRSLLYSLINDLNVVLAARLRFIFIRSSFMLVSSRTILLAAAVANDRDYNCNHCQVDEETKKGMDAENDLSRDVVFGRSLEAISRDIRRALEMLRS